MHVSGMPPDVNSLHASTRGDTYLTHTPLTASPLMCCLQTKRMVFKIHTSKMSLGDDCDLE